MIERQFISQNMKEYLIQEYIARTLTNVGLSHTKLIKTPSGVKIVVYASRPGLIVGRKGANIKELTQAMKTKFKLENPQIEIAEIDNVNLDPQIVAERVVSTLERFGTQRFKGVAHKVLGDVMNAGARGIEIVISGKIPSARAKSWRFSAGYLKKCGDIAMNFIKKAITSANLKSGTVGVQIKIMPPDVQLPDDIKLYDETEIIEKLAKEKKDDEEKEEKKKGREKKQKEYNDQKPRAEKKHEAKKVEMKKTEIKMDNVKTEAKSEIKHEEKKHIPEHKKNKEMKIEVNHEKEEETKNDEIKVEETKQ